MPPKLDMSLLAGLKKNKAALKSQAAATKPTNPSPSGAGAGNLGAFNNADSNMGINNDSSSTASTATGASKLEQLRAKLGGKVDPEKEKEWREKEEAYLAEDYDPSKPNNYDEICKRREREQEERELQELEEKEKQRKEDEKTEVKEDDFATKMMKKMGWTQGTGLGKDNQGIAAPLIMQKTDSAMGRIVHGSAMAAFDPINGPSTIVVLTNVVGRGETDDELEGEMVEEGQKYGNVLGCKILEAAPGVADAEAVRIFLKYDTPQAAKMAYSKFDNRYFGGRTVKARFYEENRFDQGDYFA